MRVKEHMVSNWELWEDWENRKGKDEDGVVKTNVYSGSQNQNKSKYFWEYFCTDHRFLLPLVNTSLLLLLSHKMHVCMNSKAVSNTDDWVWKTHSLPKCNQTSLALYTRCSSCVWLLFVKQEYLTWEIWNVQAHRNKLGIKQKTIGTITPIWSGRIFVLCGIFCFGYFFGGHHMIKL